MQPIRRLNRQPIINFLFMNKVLFTFLTLFFSLTFSFAFKLSGNLVDGNGKPIPYARVQVLDTHYGATTDEIGDFSFRIPGGSYRIRFQHLGF